MMTSIVFFFNDTATTEIYTLSLHDALPISHLLERHGLLGDPVRHGYTRPRMSLGLYGSLRRSRPRASVTASAANVSTKASARSGECFSSLGKTRARPFPPLKSKCSPVSSFTKGLSFEGPR